MQNEIEHDTNKIIRGAFCKKHHLHYDGSRKGCVVCKREKSSKVILLLAVVACLILVIIMVRPVLYPEGSPRVTGTPTAGESDSGVLDLFSSVISVLSNDSKIPKLQPEPYRKEIESIENILYRKRAADFGDIDTIGRLAAHLGENIMTNGSLAQKSLASKIIFWAAGVGAGMGVGYQNPDLVPVRAEWERIRAESFESAGWFQQPSPRLTQQQTREQSKIDPAMVSRLQSFSQRVAILIREGRRESTAVGEITGDYRGPEEREIVSKWERWSRVWRTRVDVLGRRIPPAPALDGPTEMVMAHQRLGEAVSQLRFVIHAANDYGIPFLYERNNHFESAQFALNEVDEYLKKAKAANR